MSAAPLAGDEYVRVAEFISATLRHIERLHECQRHEAAERSLYALRRLAQTIRSEAGNLGYMPDILFAAELAAIEEPRHAE